MTALRVNFLHRHVRDTVVILEDGKLLHRRYPCCDLLVPWGSLNGCHATTTQCAKGEEREWHQLV